MKRLAFAVVALAACTTNPTTPPPPATLLSADQVNNELVDAGCLAPGSSDAVAQEFATIHDPWLVCLFEGGTISGCGAPCTQIDP